jgi:hypothetical protein
MEVLECYGDCSGVECALVALVLVGFVEVCCLSLGVPRVQVELSLYDAHLLNPLQHFPQFPYQVNTHELHSLVGKIFVLYAVNLGAEPVSTTQVRQLHEQTFQNFYLMRF